MLSLLPILLGLSVLGALPRDVTGRCVLKTESPSPMVVTSFGSKHLANGKPSVYEREYGEYIEMYCGGGFNYHRSYGGIISTSNTKIRLQCQSNDQFYSITNDDHIANIHCMTSTNRMFESAIKLPNCDSDMTLVVGHDFGDIGSLKNAAICYDILGAKLKYFSYTTFPSKNRIVEKTQVGQLNSLTLDTNVTNFKNLIRSIDQSEIDNFISTEKQLASLFVSNAFQYASLAPDDQQLDDFEGFLGTVWLRVLRSGNWAHWLWALRAATDAGGHFDVRMGVSGTLQIPANTLGPCNVSRPVIIELRDGTSLPVPAYIWAHVRAVEVTGGAGDEFVLIGHNSPFFRSDNSLCSSMCKQVPWLRSSLFAGLHEFPAYGLVQCCRVKDVAQKLDNFPGHISTRFSRPRPRPLLRFMKTQRKLTIIIFHLNMNIEDNIKPLLLAHFFEINPLFSALVISFLCFDYRRNCHIKIKIIIGSKND
ncbi:uncharacterized protein LOC110178085, partial [Drosophila serrata]|uniref:uncharacterized protein LOC110178085 n=1 Tax=Drosophila serrata TaxID=7274 RepID=UPI000A1D2917